MRIGRPEAPANFVCSADETSDRWHRAELTPAQRTKAVARLAELIKRRNEAAESEGVSSPQETKPNPKGGRPNSAAAEIAEAVSDTAKVSPEETVSEGKGGPWPKGPAIRPAR